MGEAERDLAAKLAANPQYQSALRDAESESWDEPGVEGAAMIGTATERRRQWRAGLRGSRDGPADREGGREMAEICCPRAVYDDQAGWWCPEHGDQWDVTPDPDPDWRERPEADGA